MADENGNGDWSQNRKWVLMTLSELKAENEEIRRQVAAGQKALNDKLIMVLWSIMALFIAACVNFVFAYLQKKVG